MRVIVESVPILTFLALATACQKPVYIFGRSGLETSIYDYDFGKQLAAKYGSDVHVFCTGPEATQLNITMLGVVQPVEVVNETTIRITLKKPDINGYIYVCAGAQTCEDQLTVRVGPVIDLLSTNVRQNRTSRGVYYFVPIDEDYQVVCSGNNPAALTIYRNGEDVQTYISSNETLSAAVKAMGSEKLMTYSCKVTSPLGYMFYQMVSVYVDYPPKAIEFWCVEYIQQVNCTWTVSSVDTSFTLLYSEAGESVLLCQDLSNKKSRLCEWSVNEVWNRGLEVEDFAFVLQACNPVFCANQTIRINRHSVIRPKSPYGLKVLRMSSRGAVVTWRSNYEDLDMEWNLVYQLLGTQPRDMDETSVRIYCDNPVCEGEIDLPCPDALYLLKVYTKFVTSIYWSAPETITLHTDADATNVKDPICDTETELINSGPIAAYEVRKFTRYYDNERKIICKKIDALKQKLP